MCRFILALFLLPVALFGRKPEPPSTIGLTEFLNAPAIVRGEVIEVAETRGKTFLYLSVARVEVDRWYRGVSAPETKVGYDTGTGFGSRQLHTSPGGVPAQHP